jgi:hypothetical protein
MTGGGRSEGDGIEHRQQNQSEQRSGEIHLNDFLSGLSLQRK